MYRIVIVDDERMVIESLKGKIDWERHQAVFAGSCCDGKEALELIGKVQPDIVILDMKMPVMDGRDLLCHMNENGFSCEVIVSSAYTEFKYTQVAIKANVAEYLEKPIKKVQINDAIEKAIRNRKAKRVNDLKSMLEDKVYQAEWDQEIVRESHEETKEYGMILLGLCGKQGTQELEPLQKQELQELEKKLEIMCSPCTSASITAFYKKARLHEYVIIFTFYSMSINKNVLELELFANRLEKKLSQVYKGFLCFSPIFSSMSEIVPIYTQLHKELAVMNLKHRGVRRRETAEERIVASQFLSEEKKRRFFLALQRCQLDEAMKWVEQTVTDWMDREMLSMTDVDAFWHLLLDLIARGRSEMGINGNYGNVGSTAEWEPFDFSDSRYLKKRLLESMEPLLKELLKEKPHDLSQTIYQMKAIVERNYNQDLSLKYFSELYFLSEEYLSKLFKQEFAINFSDYLTRIRMEKAGEFLREGKLSVADISYLIGYSDPKYFCRMFKKQYGVPPSKYNIYFD